MSEKCPGCGNSDRLPWRSFCQKCTNKDHMQSHAIALAFILSLAMILWSAAALYGQWAYGDWKCGLPKVRCVKVKP